MDNLTHLRGTVALATAPKMAKLSDDALRRYRRGTAAWLDDSFFLIARAVGAKALYECGAHEASASERFIREIGGNALAIEANPALHNTLTRLVERSGVVTLNCGVGPEAGEASFNIPNTPGSASFRKEQNREYHSVVVPVETIDRLGRRYWMDAPLALWVDVEGSALDVLKGAEQTLRTRCRVLKVEVETSRFWAGQALADEVDAFMLQAGFVSVLRDIEFVSQFNIIYVRRELDAELDELLLKCWARLTLVKGPRLDEPLTAKSAAARVKRRIFGESGGPLLLHRIAAKLGSKSSAMHIKKKY